MVPQRQPVLPLRWVLVRPCDAQCPPRASFDVPVTKQACRGVFHQVIETTFEESRAHLGFETQRQWSDLAIERTTPWLCIRWWRCWLMACIWTVAWRDRCLVCQGATFSDAIGSGTAAPVEGRVFLHQRPNRVGRNPFYLQGDASACYAQLDQIRTKSSLNCYEKFCTSIV